MSEAELDIARNLGASSYLVYSFIKNFPGGTATDVETNLGLSRNCVDQTMRKLVDSKVLLKRKSERGHHRLQTYTIIKVDNG